MYKGRLKTGETVAVKVQRPYVLETVTIDLYIIRRLGIFLRRFPQVREGLGLHFRVARAARAVRVRAAGLCAFTCWCRPCQKKTGRRWMRV